MQFFIDTADINEIIKLNDVGLVDGVTTNPSIIAKSNKNFFESIKEICNIIKGPVSAEVAALDFKGMIEEGKKLADIADNVVVKVPLTWDGLKACKELSSFGIKTNVTLCFSASQAMLAAKVGATFISPFVGRLDDISHDGLILINDIINIYKNYKENINTKVLVASVRSPLQITKAALLGADIATIPPKILRMMVNHPLTDKGLEDFMKDWSKSGQKI